MGFLCRTSLLVVLTLNKSNINIVQRKSIFFDRPLKLIFFGIVKPTIMSFTSCSQSWQFTEKLRKDLQIGYVPSIITGCFIYFSSFLKSHWCKFEFQQAYTLMLEQERANYIVVVLLEDIPQKKLTEELKVYLRTYTYIDAREYANNKEMIRKRIRFALPKVPLKELKVIIHLRGPA